MDRLDKSIVIELAFELVESGKLREIVADYINGMPNIELGNKLSQTLAGILKTELEILQKELS